MISRLSALLLTLSLAACAFEDGEGQRAAEGRFAEDLRQARADLAPVVGSWSGTLVRAGTSIDIELFIQEDLIATGQVTADGQALYRVAPRASLASIDGRYNQTFTGTYIRSTGELILSTNQSPVLFDQIQTLSLLLRGNRLVGAARTPSGYLGEVSLQLQSRQNEGSSRDNEEVRAERLRQIYSAMVGTWTGRVINPPRSTTAEFDIILSVYIDEQPTETGRSTPVLRATYDRTSSDVLRRNLSVTYAYSNNPPSVFMTSVNPNGYSVSLSGRFPSLADGSWDLTRLIATHTNVTLGVTGTVELRKQNSPQSPSVPVPTPRPVQ